MSNSFRKKFTAKFYPIDFRKCDLVSQSRQYIVTKKWVDGRISLPRIYISLRLLQVSSSMFRFYTLRHQFLWVWKQHTRLKGIIFQVNMGAARQKQKQTQKQVYKKQILICTYYLTIEHIAQNKDTVETTIFSNRFHSAQFQTATYRHGVTKGKETKTIED